MSSSSTPSRERYRSGDQWLPLQRQAPPDSVCVERSEPIAFDVRSTRHGPILNADEWRDLQPGEAAEPRPLDDTVLALKWDAVVQGESAVAFDALSRAGNWAEFVGAIRKFSAAGSEFRLRRCRRQHRLRDVRPSAGPKRFATARSRFRDGPPMRTGAAAVDVNQLPAVTNPVSGLIVTANNEVDRGLPYFVTSDWVAPFRAQRIMALLADAPPARYRRDGEDSG